MGPAPIRMMISRYLYVLLVLPAAAQVSSNASLNGRYGFRQVFFATDSQGTITESRSAWGSLTFNGTGSFTISGQQIEGTGAPSALAGNGTYAVKPGGFVTFTNPLRAGATLNARLIAGGLAGSSTEPGGISDMLVAVQGATQTPAITGAYWISSLEFPAGGLSNVRNAFFKMTSAGAGSFVENSISGQAANLGNQLRTQTIGPNTYTSSSDGTGTMTFGSPGLDPLANLIAGTKAIYIASDGSWFVGGGTGAGSHGMIAGVRAFTSGAVNGSWQNLFFGAGMRVEEGRVSSWSGSANAAGAINSIIWSRRLRQFDSVIDFSPLHPLSTSSDGSGLALGKRVALAVTGITFTGSGVEEGNATSYELYLAGRAPAQTGTGVFVNPQGVLNAASFAPAGTPVSPGELITIFGTGFGTQNATAQTLPFPQTLAGVEVTVNNIRAPIYSVNSNPAQISTLIPFAASGPVATIVVRVNNTASNAVEVPLAPTSPGIFSIPRNGVGAGAILHPDYSVVSNQNPARRGNYVSIFLTGLGAVTPPVPDGTAAPISPLSIADTPVNVYIGGALVTNLAFKGLAPTLAGLYQLNIQIPVNAPIGLQPLAVQTGEAFTDLVDIAIGQ